mgnify:CR=1 FL=1
MWGVNDMTLKTMVLAAFSVTVLTAGIASAATCNKGRVTGTDMCKAGASELVRKNEDALLKGNQGKSAAALSGEQGASNGGSAGSSSQGMYRAALKGSSGEIGDMRSAPVGSGSTVELPLVEEDKGEDVAVVPLPAAGFMLLAGLGGLAVLRRKS